LTDFLCCVVYAQSLDDTFGSDIEGKSVIAGEARQTLREKYISFYEFASLHSQRHYKSVRIIERVQLSFFLYDGASDFACDMFIHGLQIQELQRKTRNF
jgi:hypothetical protein